MSAAPRQTYTRLQAQDLRVEAYIREDLQGASDRITAVLDRLARLTNDSNDADVESVSVTGWTNAVSARPTADALTLPRSTVHETVTEFREWATRRGYSLAPAFELATNDIDDGDEDKDGSEHLRVPLIGLAVYDTADGSATGEDTSDDGDDKSDDDDDLLAVFPYTDRDGEVQTVEDCLSTLEEAA